MQLRRFVSYSPVIDKTRIKKRWKRPGIWELYLRLYSAIEL